MARPSPPSRKGDEDVLPLFAVSPSTQTTFSVAVCSPGARHRKRKKKELFGLQTKHLTTPALSTQASYPPLFLLSSFSFFLILSADTDAHFCLALPPLAATAPHFILFPSVWYKKKARGGGSVVSRRVCPITQGEFSGEPILAPSVDGVASFPSPARKKCC